MLIEHMEQGKSFESFGAVLYRYTNGDLKAHKQTLYEWVRDYPDFGDAKKMGAMLCFDFWEELGATAVNSPPNQFNTGVYVFNMKNRFGWRDKVELSGDEEKPIKHEVTHDLKKAAVSDLMQGIRGLTTGDDEWVDINS